jgi:hypothetical protein
MRVSGRVGVWRAAPSAAKGDEGLGGVRRRRPMRRRARQEGGGVGSISVGKFGEDELDVEQPRAVRALNKLPREQREVRAACARVCDASQATRGRACVAGVAQSVAAVVAMGGRCVWRHACRRIGCRLRSVSATHGVGYAGSQVRGFWVSAVGRTSSLRVTERRWGAMPTRREVSLRSSVRRSSS